MKQIDLIGSARSGSIFLAASHRCRRRFRRASMDPQEFRFGDGENRQQEEEGVRWNGNDNKKAKSLKNGI